MLYTVIVNISEAIASDEWHRLLNDIEIDRKNSIEKLRFFDDKKRSLIAGLLIKAMITEVFPNKTTEIVFSKNYYGKPYISGGLDLFFNVSHSGEYVCCAVSDSEIGIDIEKIKTSMEIDAFESFFSEDEWQQVTDERKDKYDTFFSLWTLKESYVKKIGRGLNKELNSFSILIGDQIRVIDHQTGKRDEEFLLRSVGSSYKLAICSERCMENTEKEMTIQEFIETYY